MWLLFAVLPILNQDNWLIKDFVK